VLLTSYLGKIAALSPYASLDLSSLSDESDSDKVITKATVTRKVHTAKAKRQSKMSSAKKKTSAQVTTSPPPFTEFECSVKTNSLGKARKCSMSMLLGRMY
jgi:hypothetical protein